MRSYQSSLFSIYEKRSENPPLENFFHQMVLIEKHFKVGIEHKKELSKQVFSCTIIYYLCHNG